MSPTATLFRPEHQLSHAGAVGTPVANVAITAVVVPRPGARIDERELIDSVKGVIDPYRAPKAVLVVDELPKTSTGKIQKNAVRDKFAGHYTAGPTPGRRLVEWESRDSRRDERPAPDRGDVSLVDSGGRAHARRWTNRQSGRPGLGRRRCTRPQPRARIHGFAAAAALVVPARA